jgi:glycosyltransferase involved in cell wall biosynthesis
LTPVNIPSLEASLSLVIPVFNNKDSLAPLMDRVIQAFKTFRPLRLEFVFIDDGSSDGSWNEILRLKESSIFQVHGIKFTRNFGQVNAIISGLEIAQSDFIAVMSADLQDPPELLPRLVELLINGNEIVIGHRESRDESPLRRVTSNLAYAIARRSYSNMPQGGFDYFAVTSRVGRLFLGLPGRHRFIQGDLLWLGIPITVVPYAREKREFGKSGWSLSKRWKYFIDIALDGSYFPIKVMSLIGLTIASISMVYAILIVFTRYFGQTPFPGWAPIMISILFVGGLIMMMLGIVGEYIWRIYDEVRAKPKYVIDITI